MVSRCKYQELRILTNVLNLAVEDVQKKICKRNKTWTYYNVRDRIYETYPSLFCCKAVSFQLILSTLISNHRKSLKPSSLPPRNHFKRSPCYSRALKFISSVQYIGQVYMVKHLISDLETTTFLTRSTSPCVMKGPNIRASQSTVLHYVVSYIYWRTPTYSNIKSTVRL